MTAIIDPNLGIREELELTTVTLRPSKDGQSAVVLSGFVTALTDTQLALVDLTGHTSTVAVGDILSKTNTPVSIMPEGLLDSLTETQTRDLFAFLQAERDPVPAD